MQRRAFLGGLGLLASLLASSAGAQQAGKRLPRVGVIWEASATVSQPAAAALREGLRELGYGEGQSILIEDRHAAGQLDQVPSLAAELLALGVDVLVVGGTAAAQSAKALTATVPIVFTLSGDPVGSRLVATLARPRGNATGLSNQASELSGKQLEVLKAALPQVQRIGVLYNPGNVALRVALARAREAARTLAVELHFAEVRRSNELAHALSQLKARRVGALLVLSDPVLAPQSEVSRLAGEARLPAMATQPTFAEAGGLFAYGPSFIENYRRAASYVVKILKGATPADLPVEQPTKFEFVINLKTAKTLGIAIPPSLLQRADQLIQQ